MPSAYAPVHVALVTLYLGKAEATAYLVFSIDSDLSLPVDFVLVL